MKVLLLLAFVAIGQSALIGRNKCTYGPSYWCSNIDHAKECNSIQHCMSTVWKNQNQGLVGSTETCFDVIMVIDHARQSSDSELLEHMAKGCTDMPAEKHSVCKEFMRNNQDEVFLLLRSDLPAANVAAILGLCGGSPDTVPQPHVNNLERNQVAPVSADYCTDCLNFFGDLKEIINSTDRKLIETVKERFCTRLGPYEELCKQTVDLYGNFITNYSLQQLKPQDICSRLQMCNSTGMNPVDFKKASRPFVAKVAPVSADYCTDCLNFIGDVQEIVNGTEGHIIEMVKKNVCPRLGPFEDLCEKTVDIYGGYITYFLMQQLDPQDICFLLRMCKTSTKTPVEFYMMVKSYDVKMQSSGVICDWCKTFALDAQNALKDPTLQKDILTALTVKVCPLLPGDLAAECKTYVSEYGPVAFQLLIAELDPESFCETVGLCNATETTNKLAVVPLAEQVSSIRIIAPGDKHQAQFTPVCGICEEIVSKLEGMIGSNATKQEITAALEKVCSLCPDGLRSECVVFIEKYGPMLENMLLTELPDAICTLLGLCVGEKSVHVERQELMGDKCLACEAVIGYLRNFIDNPNNKETIEQLLEKFCLVVPSSYQGVCKLIIETEFPYLIRLLDQYDDPQMLCSELHLCASTKTMNNKSYQPSKPLLFNEELKLQRIGAKP